MRRNAASTIAVLAALVCAAQSQAQTNDAPAPAAAQAAQSAILAAKLPPAVAPGRPFRITYNWKAAPMDVDYSVFVHIVNSAGATILQGDHAPPAPTSRWAGPVSYSQIIDIPATTAEGSYKILAGLYTATADGKGWRNAPLAAGAGVSGGEGNSFQVGSFQVDVNAPLPILDSDQPATLDLKSYKLTWSEEFNDLSVSSRGPNKIDGVGGTRWMAHTPYGGDFGDAGFADPVKGFPFTVQDGIGRIEAKKDAAGWKAGLLSSADPKGEGFSQLYGYFEARARFPEGPGTWPAFWMQGVDSLKNAQADGTEIDIVEQYGHARQILHATLHFWPGKGKDPKGHTGLGQAFIVPDMSQGFHRYGLDWNEKTLTWYFDGVALWSQPTPAHAHRPMYLLVNLALGGGWPIEGTPNPRRMYVDYVRAYSKIRP